MSIWWFDGQLRGSMAEAVTPLEDEIVERERTVPAWTSLPAD
jgi:hypothetical protein